MKNKRGAITDIILWICVGIVFVIFMGLLYYAFGTKVFPELKNAFNSFQDVNGQNLTNLTNQIADDVINGMADSYGWITFGVLIAMAINILLGCFLVRAHPGTAVTIYVLVGIVALLISVYVSNGYDSLVNSGSEFAELLLTKFSGATFILENLPIWTVVIFFIGLVLMLSGIPRDKNLGGGPTA